MNELKHILILGGTGAMGCNLVSLLSKQANTHVVVTSRRVHPNSESVEYKQGNAHEFEWLKGILQEREWDAIVDFMVYQTSEFQQRANLLLNSTKQYVFFSSARVYADAGNSLITEESPRLLDVCTDAEYLKTDEYALAKARQENILTNSSNKNWTIIRPYITFSSDRLQLGVMEKELWLVPALNNRPIVFSKDLAHCYTTMTDGLVVAKCIVALLFHKDALGEIFHIASNKSQTWETILNWYIEAYKKTTNTTPTVYMLDKWDCKLGGGEYQYLYDRLYNRRFDNSKICRFISQEVFESTEETIKKAITIFIKSYNPHITDLNQRIEFDRGVITGCFLPWKYIKGRKNKLKVLAYKLHIFKLLQNIHNLWH